MSVFKILQGVANGPLGEYLGMAGVAGSCDNALQIHGLRLHQFLQYKDEHVFIDKGAIGHIARHSVRQHLCDPSDGAPK